MQYVHGYKSTRVVRWRNRQPCVGDCKAGIIPRCHIKKESICSSYFIQSIQDSDLLDLYQAAITRIVKAVADCNSSIDDGLQKSIFQYSGIIFSFIYQFVIKKEVLYMKIMECSINGLVKE